MAKKKTPATFLEKLSEKASHVKEDLIAGKDHLVEVAGDAIASVKHSIEEFKAKKAATKKIVPVKKKAVKKAAATKKSAPAKKSAPVKSKPAAKTVKKAAEKTAKKAPAKKLPGRKK